MEKINNNTTLIDTYNRKEEDFFEGFVDYIEGCTDGHVEGEGTDMKGVWDNGEVFETFWGWYYRECECIEEDFFDGFRGAQEQHPTKCVVSGCLGLWNGKHVIVPTICKSIYSAVQKCLKDAYEYVIKIEDGVLVVENHHHDGTNIFEIRIFNEENIEKIEDWEGDEDSLADFLNDKNNVEPFYYEHFYVVY